MRWRLFAFQVSVLTMLVTFSAKMNVQAQEQDLPPASMRPGHEGTSRQERVFARYSIYLVTMFPGDSLFTGFGHVALRVVDHAELTDEVYDYGAYEYEDPLLAWKFLIGTLPYYCSRTTFSAMTEWYSQDFGGIMIQELNLTPEEAEKLVERVNYDSLPWNAAYKYHHFNNNCSTRLRDILDDVLGGALSAQTRGIPAGRSLRELINASLSNWQFSITRWVVFGLLNYTVDVEADRWAQMFLPWYLSDEVGRLVRTDLPGAPPLVLSKKMISGVERPAPKPPGSWFGMVFLVLLALIYSVPWLLSRSLSSSGGPALLSWSYPVAARKLAGILIAVGGLSAGLYGTILAFSWAVSPYPETKNNFTLLCFHPLYLLLVPAGVKMLGGSSRWGRVARWFLAINSVVCGLTATASLAGVIPQRVWPYGLVGMVMGLAALSNSREKPRWNRRNGRDNYDGQAGRE